LGDKFLSSDRDVNPETEAEATAFFTQEIENNHSPDRVVIDKSGTNLAGLQNMHYLLILNGWC
jgi:putative transposase